MPSHQVMLKRFSCVFRDCTFQQIVSNDWHHIKDVFCRQYSEGEAKVSKHHQDVSTSRIPRGFGQVQHRDTFKFNIKIIQMKKTPNKPPLLIIAVC